MSKECKRCYSSIIVKNGKVRAKQRYKCKDCGYNFVEGDKRERTSAAIKAFVLLMYGSVNASYGMIAKLFNVTRPTVLNWIRTMGKSLPEPEIKTKLTKIEMDEMWHFINKKNKKYGFGSNKTTQISGIIVQDFPEEQKLFPNQKKW